MGYGLNGAQGSLGDPCAEVIRRKRREERGEREEEEQVDILAYSVNDTLSLLIVQYSTVQYYHTNNLLSSIFASLYCNI